MEPLVSAVITTHNRSGLLKKAIESVMAQTYENLECIVVDDASTDDTQQLFENAVYLKKFKYIKIEHSKGGNHARNTGIKNANGKYIAFLDDDDEWLPEKIEKQVALALKNPECKVVFCGRKDVIIDDKKTEVRERNLEILRDGDLHRTILWTIPCVTSTLFVEKEILEQVGLFDESLGFWQEYELCIRLFQITKAAAVKENLVLFRREKADKQRLTNKLEGWLNAVDQIHNKHKKIYDTLNYEEKKRAKILVYNDAVARAVNGDNTKLKRVYLKKLFFVTKSPKALIRWIINKNNDEIKELKTKLKGK